MTFLTRTQDAKSWKNIINALATVTEEATLTATADGITCRAMDYSHVAMVDIDFAKDAFSEYMFDGDNLKIGIRIEDVLKILKRADDKDSLEVGIANEGLLTVNIMGDDKKEYEIHTIDAVQGDVPKPNITFNASIALSSNKLVEALTDIGVVSDFVQITIPQQSDKIVFDGKSDLGKGSITLSKNDSDVLTIAAKEDTKSVYSLDYLQQILSAIKSPNAVKLEYSAKMPLQLTFQLTENAGKVQYLLAPRVQDE